MTLWWRYYDLMVASEYLRLFFFLPT